MPATTIYEAIKQCNLIKIDSSIDEGREEYPEIDANGNLGTPICYFLKEELDKAKYIGDSSWEVYCEDEDETYTFQFFAYARLDCTGAK